MTILPLGTKSLSRRDHPNFETEKALPEFGLKLRLCGPNWGLFCPEIRAFTGFWGEISSTVSKVLSDRVKYYSNTKRLAVYSR